MLSDAEKLGFHTLLCLLNDDELMSLVSTVTKRQIQVYSRKEAIEALLTYTENASELLRRKKMKREYLFKYLAKEHVVVNIDSDKRALIQKILQHLGSDDVLTDSMDVNMEEDIKPEVSQGTLMSCFPDRNNQDVQTGSYDFKPVVSSTASSQTGPNTLSHNTYQTAYMSNFSERRNQGVQTGSCDLMPAVSSSAFFQTNPVQDTHPVIQPTSHFPGPSAVLVPQFHQQSVQTVPQISFSGNHSVASVNNQSSVTSGQSTREETQKLGESFARWFYQILNSHNPSTGDAPEDFGPHHFWDEVTLTVYTNGPVQSQDDFKGSVLVSQRMLALVKEDQLIFNANIGPEGLFVKASPHGLVLIMVCGTLHRGNSCLGIFQQVFGIVRDPRYDNNWKVKVMKLSLKSTEVMVMPKLTGNIEGELNALIPVQ
ncbi:hypothetical protein CHS0354_020038 [Potamilus streckersoni]|uniref:Uncharacterized protein n=1 Tax=Potamilus streckersoni TaxID=2493646 RepID=A0AAE0S7H3_9BIVA|nr:hypothetical protein CHS0354_020038 [Potamilus streckersoni]